MRKFVSCWGVPLFITLFFICISFTTIAQKTVSGKVTGGTTNQPINGASVLVKGTNIGTTTDAMALSASVYPREKCTRDFQRRIL